MKYSLTKNPNADHVVSTQKDEAATKIEVTKNPGNETVAFSKDSLVKVALVKKGGGTL